MTKRVFSIEFIVPRINRLDGFTPVLEKAMANLDSEDLVEYFHLITMAMRLRRVNAMLWLDDRWPKAVLSRIGKEGWV